MRASLDRKQPTHEINSAHDSYVQQVLQQSASVGRCCTIAYVTQKQHQPGIDGSRPQLAAAVKAFNK